MIGGAVVRFLGVFTLVWLILSGIGSEITHQPFSKCVVSLRMNCR